MNKSSKPNKKGSARRGSKQNKQAKPKKQGGSSFNSRVVNAPISQGKVSVMSKPRTQSLPNGDIIVHHREFIQDISGSIPFTATSIPINPGLPQVMPWLSSIASSWESYVFEDLKFYIETQCSTVKDGTVIIAVDFDPGDPAPASKAQALAYRDSVRSPVWSSSMFHATKEDLHKRKTYFVRKGALVGGQDVSVYDTGRLYICTSGQADETTISELYVEYTVKLMSPQLGDISIGEAIYGRFTGNSQLTKFSNKTGNIQITVENIDGQDVEFLFLRPWQGYLDIQVVGTGLGTSVLVSATADVQTTQTIVNATQTQMAASLNIDAPINTGFVLKVPNLTLTQSIATWGQADVA